MTDVKKSEIANFVQRVLNERFKEDNIEKRQFNKDQSDKLNFSCPFCGDSQKSARKKRGNIFFAGSKTYYKCFNGGCGISLSISEFVKKLARKFNIDLSDFNFTFNSEADKEEIPQSKPDLVRFLMASNKENLVTVSDFENVGFIRGDDPSIGPNSIEFIEKRKFHCIPNWEEFVYFTHADDKAIILNVEKKTDAVIGYAIRKFHSSEFSPKYILQNYNDINKTFGVNVKGDMLSDCVFLSDYFNLLNIDFSKQLTILEGQIDSMFCRNAFSTTGLSKVNKILNQLGSPSNIRIFFDRDKDGKSNTIKLIKKGYSVFMWSKFISKMKQKWNSYDDIIEISKIKDCNDIFNFLFHRLKINWDAFNSYLDEFYSTSKLDIAYV